MKTEKVNQGLNWVLVALATGAVGLIGTFYYDWVRDEAEEEGLTFDSVEQKVDAVEHIEKLPVIEMKVKQAQDENFQKQVLDKLEELDKKANKVDSLTRLNVYLTNKIEDSH